MRRMVGGIRLIHCARNSTDFRGDARRHVFRRADLHRCSGIAAAVMATNGPLMPFFFPISPASACSARRGGRLLRARPPPRGGRHRQLVALPRRAQAAGGRRHRHGCRAAARDFRPVAAGRRAPFTSRCSAGPRRSIIDFIAAVFTTPRGWALIGIGAASAQSSAGSFWRSASPRCRCWSIATSARREAVSASWRAAHANKAGDDPLGPDRGRACSCSARSRCSSGSPSSFRGSAIRPGTCTRG